MRNKYWMNLGLLVMGRIGKLLLGVVGFATLLTPGSAVQAGTAADCEKLVKLEVENTTITSATLIPAGGELPEYCRVQGHVDTEIGFEVRLPTDWNGKFYFQGNGGFAGSIPAPGPGLVRGYAVAAGSYPKLVSPDERRIHNSLARRRAPTYRDLPSRGWVVLLRGQRSQH